jgi:hypothetical protein
MEHNCSHQRYRYCGKICKKAGVYFRLYVRKKISLWYTTIGALFSYDIFFHVNLRLFVGKPYFLCSLPYLIFLQKEIILLSLYTQFYNERHRRLRKLLNVHQYSSLYVCSGKTHNK